MTTALDRSVDAYLGYLATNRGLAKNTLDAYGRDLVMLASFLAERGRADPAAVAPDDLVEYVGWLREQHLQPSSVERLVASGGADYRLREAQSPALAAYVAERTTPGDTIFNLGRQPELYFYANRRPASRYIDTYPLDYDPRTLETLLADLEMNRPAYIVDTQWPMYLQGIDSPYPLEIQQFLERHYVHERTFEFEPWLREIYARLSPREDDVTRLQYFADVWRRAPVFQATDGSSART